jgi:hypothetical protein
LKCGIAPDISQCLHGKKPGRHGFPITGELARLAVDHSIGDMTTLTFNEVANYSVNNGYGVLLIAIC